MTVFFWVVDLLIPATMLAFGLGWRKHPPRQINSIYGYRSRRSMQSRAAWDEAHALTSRIWIRWGTVLALLVVLSKLLIPLAPEWLSLIHSGAGVAVLIATIPVVEHQLKKWQKEKDKEIER